MTQTAPPSHTQTRSFASDLDSWLEAHQEPGADAPQERKEAYRRMLAEASAQWVRDWPRDVAAWQWRLDSVARLETSSNEEVERLGEQVLRILRDYPVKGMLFAPYQLLVAEVWSERKVRLTQCLSLTDEALAEIDRSRKENPLSAKRFALNYENGIFHTLRVQFDIALELHNFTKAKASIDSMKLWCDNNPQVPRNRFVFLAKAGHLAELEGRKMDELAYYQALLSQTPGFARERERAHALWNELGGTEEAFALWSSLQEPRRPIAAEQVSAWTELQRSLSSFEGVDLGGKTWSARNFQGKTTLTTVWASWCAPCRAELPAVQRLFDQLKDRTDIQVVTISMDDNSAQAEAMVAKEHYTFPVIFARFSQVEEFVGWAGIPQTWISDRDGTVRMGRAGYDPGDWPQAMLDRIATVSSAAQPKPTRGSAADEGVRPTNGNLPALFSNMRSNYLFR